jgi:hypothetical protein
MACMLVGARLGAIAGLRHWSYLLRAIGATQSSQSASPELKTGTPPQERNLLRKTWGASECLAVAVHGVVVSRRPGFGISIKFTEMTEEVRQRLQRIIQSLIVRSE